MEPAPDLTSPGPVEAPARAASRLASLGPVATLLAFYARHRRFAPAAFFLGGTIWDAATVYRIDSLIDNGLVITYLVLLGALIPISALVESGRLTGARLEKARPWLVPIKQFLFGALFSTFVFFYVQSASWSGTAFFLLFLVGLLIANEFLHERIASVHLDLGLYLVAATTFFVYFVPMVTTIMNVVTFLVASALATGLVYLLAEFLRKRDVFPTKREVTISRSVIAGLTALFVVAYMANWIPPVPLAVRESGIYHGVRRENGGYELRREVQPWWAFWRNDDSTFRRAPGDEVYCFTSVFAPTRLENRIVHVWQFKDEDGDWQTADRIGYEIVGGRDHGYRGYTFKRSVSPGDWRVSVETESGRILSRISFEVFDTDEPAEWIWEAAR